MEMWILMKGKIREHLTKRMKEIIEYKILRVVSEKGKDQASEILIS